MTVLHENDSDCNVAYNNNTYVCPPANDNCSAPIALTVNPNFACGSVTAGTLANATASVDVISPCFGNPNNDVWFSFVATNTSHQVSLLNVTPFTDMYHAVYSGTCGALVNKNCSDNDLSTVTGLTVGVTYLVRVYSYGAAAVTTTFNVCIGTPPPPPANDECAAAVNLTVNADYDCGAVTAGTIASATASAEANSCFGTDDDDVWYTFTATSTAHRVSLINITGSTSDMYMAISSGSCGSLTNVLCSDPETANLTGLTIGAPYTVRVYTYTATAGQTSSFNICVGTQPPPPANDLCANAIPVSCNSITAGTTSGGSTTGAPALTCGATTFTSAPGVWYTVQGWGGPITASLCGASFDTKIGIFTGSCGTFTCIGGNDDFCSLQSQVSWASTAATTYYIYVTAFSTNSGPFNLSVTCGDNNPVCTANGLTMEFQTDGAPFQTTWEIRNEAGTVVATSGGPLVAPFGIQTENGCVPDGCYTLRVLDSFGDGMTTGGYILRTQGTNQRIIDNRNNFSTGSVSAISGGQGFCLPLSSDKLIFTSCDKLDWINGQYVVASPNAAVSAEWIPSGANSVQDANSGYEFWIFDPNGSYSFRRFRSHNVSDGFAASATRACHMKLNNWAAASQVPANVLMNVRIRARVNGVNGAFGPACRLAINPTLAACPLTQLMNIPGDPNFSCGATRQWGTGNLVHARPVSGANRYQFRFRIPAEGFSVTRTVTTYFTQLNWAVLPLQDGKTYDVDVRVSKDGGATWCSASDPWGPVCQLTIDNTPAGNGNQNFAGISEAAELRMFPNPNRGDVLNFSISAIEEGVNTVSVDIYDLTGKRMSARTIAVADGNVNTVIDLNGELAAGMYLVNITAGDKTYTERLVIQP
ncbi:MAG: T9SS type A sorting domain-containing protein [Flavobacteriales bacterium]|nr:T9SS type A sorting domain-containing protein [Flavobacteriales bacterium]